MEMTTIQIPKEDLERLEELKIHPSQPMREVIEMLLDERERDELLETVIKEHPKLYVELSDLKGKKKEDLLKKMTQ
jgi:predicted CopG family antitoxin